jgi:aconitate hydratase
MALNLTQKLIQSHLVSGNMTPGEEIYINVDQTLTHDITAVMAYLAFEALDIPKVKTEVSVSYVDHNLLQVDSKGPDDHLYLQSIAKKYGLYFSRPGNGICHMVHYFRFGKPGKSLLGTDSHTPTGGAIGMLAIGAGGMDVATAMAGLPLRLKMPKIVRVELKGKLGSQCSTKDVILEMLRRLTVKGGVGKVFEYVGEGIKTLTVAQRSTITNMGAELGATTSVFPSDEEVKRFLKAQGREQDYIELLPDEGCSYDEYMEINLSELEPIVACPDMPDKVKPVKEMKDVKVDQVFIGSCTNGSYSDIKKAAEVLDGHTVNENVSLTVSVGTKQILQMLMEDGTISKLLLAGARLLECACGPCTGIGQAAPTNGISVRTSNRNFKGRGGTPDAKLYLVSPEVAAATAITGYLTEPSEVCDIERLATITEPEEYIIDDKMLIKPIEGDTSDVEIIRGPNIKPLPIPEQIGQTLEAPISLKTIDNISTDDITPASANFSAMRSNIPMISEFAFSRYDKDFVTRAKEYGKSIIIGGENYGQGSSREHAAICPMYLGVKAVIAKSMARIHKNNLINHGVLPLVFENKNDYDGLEQGDLLEINNCHEEIRNRRVTVYNKTKGTSFTSLVDLSDDEVEIILSGGQLRFIKNQMVTA